MKKLLIASCCLTLLGLALMVWSVLQPTPLPVMLAMSLGQVIGTAAFAAYGLAVVLDVRRKWRAQRDSIPPPMGTPREPEPPAS